MVKKMKMSKEDMKQVSGGWVDEVPVGYYTHTNEDGDYDSPTLVIGVYDNVNGNLIKMFAENEVQEADEFDKNYEHGNTPKRNDYDIFYEYWNG